MAKYPKVVLTADRTLMSPYRGISLASFFGCAPAIDVNRDHSSFWYHIFGNQVTPRVLFDFICNPIPHTNGLANYAPYGLRKVEAALVRDGYSRDDVVVAHPDQVERFIGPGTEVVGTYEMDPLGMGPVTMTFTYGRKQMSFDEFYSRDLHLRIKAAKEKSGSNAKIIAGASGTWQYNYDPAKIEEYGLYGIVEGDMGGIGPEMDGAGGKFFDSLINGEMEIANPFKKNKFKVEIKEFNRDNQQYHGRFIHCWEEPSVEEIPTIINPSMHGMVEVMRGCGRGCKFCDVTLRPLRYYPVEKVQKEIEINMKYGGFKKALVYNDETPEDSWETIRLIHELETEQPDSKFTVTPLTFVPIGLLEKSEFFDIGNTMDPPKLGVMYKTWQHNFKHGIQKFMGRVGRDRKVKNLFFAGLARSLGGVPLAAMEKFARSKSPEHEKVIEKIKASYW